MKFGIGKMGSSEFDFNLKNVNYPSRGTTSCLLLHQKCFLGAPNSPLNFCQKFYQKRYSKCFGLLCSQFKSNMQVSYHFGKLTPCLQWYWSQIWSKPKDQWEESSWKLPTNPTISFKLDLGSKKFFHQGDHFLRGFKNKKENPRGLASNSLKTSKLQIFCNILQI